MSAKMSPAMLVKMREAAAVAVNGTDPEAINEAANALATMFVQIDRGGYFDGRMRRILRSVRRILAP